MKERTYYVYFMTNSAKTVIYTGVTNNLKSRAYQHKEGVFEGFTKRYRVHELVYYETFAEVRDAIAREKQIKAGSRKRKMELIDAFNPRWRDLYDEV
jgi:putative endonuclease